MNNRLLGRTAVITGAGDGIGQGIARRFAAEGAQVMVTDLDGRAAERVAQALRQEFAAEADHLTTDVRDKRQVVEMIETTVGRFGTVDVLVNNAWGGGSLSRLESKTDEQLAHGMSVAYYGPFWAMQAAFPIMRAQACGNIVNLCSLNGVNAHMGTAEYNCAKEALRALTRTAARGVGAVRHCGQRHLPRREDGGVPISGGGTSRDRPVGRRDQSHGSPGRSRVRHRARRGLPRQ